MINRHASRWVIIGNSGSGKSTLAENIGSASCLSTYDLDLVHWHSGGQKRDIEDAKSRVTEIASGNCWVIEGIYGWLAEVALPRAETLIWIDLSWETCRSGLLSRGLRRGMNLADQDALLVWAEDYWTRTTSSSFKGHERLYQEFAGNKSHLRSRAEIESFQATRPAKPVPLGTVHKS